MFRCDSYRKFNHVGAFFNEHENKTMSPLFSKIIQERMKFKIYHSLHVCIKTGQLCFALNIKL